MTTLIKYTGIFMRYLLVIVLMIAISPYAFSQAEVSLFSYWKYFSDPGNSLYNTQAGLAFKHLDAREKEITNLSDVNDWENRRMLVRDKLDDIIGDFPEKTPLNPKITGILKGDGFRVEKIIYESQPGFHVTAALFLPDGLTQKAPAILYCSGHSWDSFRSDVYQHAIINLVKKGFIVLAFDPVGQGERLQYLDKKGKKSLYDTPTKEHSYVGGQCFITGQSLARIMIWDGIRSIDYLESRVEVDPDRIGITGRSGGGTQSVYISAFDDRIKASAPENYVTSFRYLLTSIGPQDAEQNLPHFLKHNLDFADYLEVRVPKPTLIISTLNDFFSIQGARETYDEVRKVYEIYGKADNIQISEDIAEHQSTLKNREAMYAFFQKHLNLPGNPLDKEVTKFRKKELQVTETGQVLTALQGETVFSLNRQASLNILKDRIPAPDTSISNNTDLSLIVRNVTGFEEELPNDTYLYSGTIRQRNYKIDKYLIQGDNNVHIPLVIIIPDSAEKKKAVVVLNPDGKSAELKTGLPEYLVSRGFHVVIPDLTGSGELSPTGNQESSDSYISHSSYNKWYAGVLTGKSLVGMRMEDISRINELVFDLYDIEYEELYGIARNIFTADLLHYQTAVPDFTRIALINPLVSYRTLVLNKDYDPNLIQSALYGVLPYYDIPDLVGNLAPSKVLLINVRDQSGNIIDALEDDPDLQQMLIPYRRKNIQENIEIRNWSDEPVDLLFGKWLD